MSQKQLSLNNLKTTQSEVLVDLPTSNNNQSLNQISYKKKCSKRSMKQLNKILIIKSDDQKSKYKCKYHGLQLKYLCKDCVAFSICQICKNIHQDHQLEQYQNFQQKITQTNDLIEQTLNQMASNIGIKQQCINVSFKQLSLMNENYANSSKNIFLKLRKFIDQLQSLTQMQLKNNLIKKRTQIIKYQKQVNQMRNSLSNMEIALFNQSTKFQFLSQNFIYKTLNPQPTIQSFNQENQKLIKKLQQFLNELKSPLMIDKKLMNQDKNINTKRSVSQINPILQKYLIKNTENVKTPNASFIKTLNLIGKQNFNLKQSNYNQNMQMPATKKYGLQKNRFNFFK